MFDIFRPQILAKSKKSGQEFESGDRWAWRSLTVPPQWLILAASERCGSVTARPTRQRRLATYFSAPDDDFSMQRILLKSKIHRATVTDAQLHYEGSVTIDHDLMLAANIAEFEQVHIYDVNNGNRLITYAIQGPAGSGTICINGAAAHLVSPGNLIIICAYAPFEEAEVAHHRPRVVLVDSKNRKTD